MSTGHRLALSVILLGTACACFGGTNHLPDYNPPPAANVETVDYVVQVNSFLVWTWTRWYRLSDDERMIPISGLVSTRGDFCVCDGGVWATANPGDRYACPGGWRTAHQ